MDGVVHDYASLTLSDGYAPPVLMGTGTAPSHHGELLQGVFERRSQLHRGLVTLPCSLFGSRANVLLNRAEPALNVVPCWKTKALAAAVATLDALGLIYGGRLELHGNVRVGLGMGSSTSDVTAAILAVLAATRRHLPPERVARIAVAVEQAADPLMFDRMLLFGQREGDVIEDLYRPMVPIEVLGFAYRDGGLDTLSTPPARYEVWEIECFRALRGLLRRSVARGDVAALGRVATASARINQRFLPVPRFHRMLEIAEETDAVGVQVAHSGTIAGLLYDPAHPRLERVMAIAARRLAELRFHETWRYLSRSEPDARTT